MSVLDLPLDADVDTIMVATQPGKKARVAAPVRRGGKVYRPNGFFMTTEDNYERRIEDDLYDEGQGPSLPNRRVNACPDPVGDSVAIRIGAAQQVLANYATSAMLTKRPKCAATLVDHRDPRARQRYANAVLKAAAAANRATGLMARGAARVRNDEGVLVDR